MKNYFLPESFKEKDSGWNQIRRVMKLTTCSLLLCSCFAFASNVNSQNARVNLNKRQAQLEEVLNEIESQTDYLFVSNRNIDLTRKVSVRVKDKPVWEVLDNILENTGLTFTMEGVNIILSEKEISSVNVVQQQKKKITGTVVEQNGEPVIGANVVEKGTTNGTITDVNGNFELEVYENAFLRVSFIGYIDQEVPVKGKKVLLLTLQEDTQNIEEVVVVGYGTTKKRDLTGSIFQVSGEKMSSQAVMNDPVQYLQGKVPGADITVGSSPGSNSKIAIRGYNSLKASNDPLIVVDDAPFAGKLDEINPAEIEKIDILKDASSTAIYGSRGANGVIIITTKRAQKGGKLSISYDGYYGVTKSFSDYDMMSPEKYADYKRATFYGKSDNEIFDAIQLDVLNSKQYVDWQDVMFSGSGYKTDHNVTINQSTGKNRNMIVLGYNRDQSIISNMSYERFSARLNGDLDLSNTLTMGYSVQLTRTLRNNGDNTVWRFGSVLDPLTKIYDDNGDLLFYNSEWYASQRHSNPLFDIDKNNVDNQTKRNRTSLNLYANWTILPGLKFRSSFTYDFATVEDGDYYASKTQKLQDAPPSATFKKSTDNNVTITNLLNYRKEFNEHTIEGSFVQDFQRYTYEQVGLTGQGMPYYGKWYNVNEAPSVFTRISSQQQWTLFSLMARLNYSFRDKYLLTLTGRYDGSSRLASGNQWDIFPSVALAWRIGEEEFVKSLNLFSNLKLRLSWGNSGNTAIETYATQGKLNKYSYYFGKTEGAAIGYIPTELPNASLGWERTEEYNIGLDYGFLNNRINGSIDFYQRNTSDLLMPRSLPVSTGYKTTWQNIGKTRNTGLEIALNTVVIDNGNFRWNIDATFAYNKNQIVELFNGKEDSPGNNWFIGKPFYVDRLYKYAGVWQLGEEEEAGVYGRVPGNPKVEDVNKNGKYDEEDLSIYNKIPKFTAGLSTGFYYKGFDLNIYLYSRLDYGEVLGVLTTEAGSSRTNHLDVDFWTPENPTNESPKPVLSNPQDLLVKSDYAYRDLSFVRVKNINLGYTLPLHVSQKILSNRLRVYFLVDNPFIITGKKYVGLDPENCNSYTDHRPLTSFVFGVNASF